MLAVVSVPAPKKTNASAARSCFEGVNRLFDASGLRMVSETVGIGASFNAAFGLIFISLRRSVFCCDKESASDTDVMRKTILS